METAGFAGVGERGYLQSEIRGIEEVEEAGTAPAFASRQRSPKRQI